MYAYLFGVVMYICIIWLGCQTRGWTYPRTPVRIITVKSRKTEISKSALKSKAEGVYSYSTVNTHNLECSSTIRTINSMESVPYTHHLICVRMHHLAFLLSNFLSFKQHQNADFSVFVFKTFSAVSNVARMHHLVSFFSFFFSDLTYENNDYFTLVSNYVRGHRLVSLISNFLSSDKS